MELYTNVLILKLFRLMFIFLLLISMFFTILSYIMMYYFYVIDNDVLFLHYFYEFIGYGIYSMFLFIPLFLIDNKIIKLGVKTND